MSLLGSSALYLSRSIVSTSNYNKGIVTFKFCKDGIVLYVHIDTRIPCKALGSPIFCSCTKSSEVLCSLIEKAYAKLHGCYESLTHGLIEDCILDFAHTFIVRTLRFEMDNSTCDDVWDALDMAFSHGDSAHGDSAHGNKSLTNLVGCMRTTPYPYLPHSHDVPLNQVYQVLGIFVAEASSTSILDGVTVGLIAVRTLRSEEGEGCYSGRWKKGHSLWDDYPYIHSLCTRHMAILLAQWDLPQSIEQDVFWMQIEDFISIFNRLYIIHDQTIKTSHINILTRTYQITPSRKQENEVFAIHSFLKQDLLLQGKALLGKMLLGKVTEQADIAICVRQLDARFTRRVSGKQWSGRDGFLEDGVKYSTAIGVVVVRMEGVENKGDEGKGDENHGGGWLAGSIQCSSNVLVYSAKAGISVSIPPGVYAFIPMWYSNNDGNIPTNDLKSAINGEEFELTIEILFDTLNLQFLDDTSLTSVDFSTVDTTMTTVQVYNCPDWEWKEFSHVVDTAGIYADVAALLKRNSQRGIDSSVNAIDLQSTTSSLASTRASHRSTLSKLR